MNPHLQLAQRKAQEYAQRPEVVAVALTGSLARDMTWAGSDVDLWAFTRDEPATDFEDGVDEGVYWEIDIKSLSWLSEQIEDVEGWEFPPRLEESDDVTILEALWGCKVLHDNDGTLTQAKRLVDTFMRDSDWLNVRASNYLLYGHGCLDGLAFAPPLTAILKMRQVVIQYGITSYWMNQGQLLSSVMRIPERLWQHSDIQQAVRMAFGLNGQAGAEQFKQDFTALEHHAPMAYAAFVADYQNEILPTIERGAFEGAVCYARQLLAEWLHPEALSAVLGLEPDLEAQKERVLMAARACLTLCAEVE